MYIEGKFINGVDNLSLIHQVRNEVFGNVDYDTSHLYDLCTDMICDEMAVHAVAWMEGKIVGCGTLFYDGETYLLDMVAVPVEERRKKYGDFIVRMLIDRAFQRGADQIVSYVNKDVFPFLSSIGFGESGGQDDIVRCVLKRGFVCKECQTRKD